MAIEITRETRGMTTINDIFHGDAYLGKYEFDGVVKAWKATSSPPGNSGQLVTWHPTDIDAVRTIGTRAYPDEDVTYMGFSLTLLSRLLSASS